MTGSTDIVEGCDLQFQPPDRTPDQLDGLRVLVLGLGRHGGGTDLIRFLVSHGAIVSVSENAPEKELAASLAKLEGIDLHRKTFGGHKSEDLDDCDWVVVNPAIPPSSPFLGEIARSNTQAVTEMGLALSWLPSKHLAAITGTNGKSTTCVLARDMLSASGISVKAGGNLGGSLLGALNQPDPDRRYIVEISSFQAERLEQGGSRPRIVSVTNLSPDHLDW
ncbi:MAG: Mur ligase family protein, partial [Planctomycetota bacterium]